MKTLVTFAVVAVCALSLCATAAAEDLVPPNWRGAANTSWVQWEFDDPADFQDGVNGPPFTPDYNDGFLPFGEPTLTHIPGPGAGWHEKQPTWENGGADLYDPAGIVGDGWANLSGELIIELWNDPTPRPRKEVWIQLVWEPQAPGNLPTVQITDPLGQETTIPLVHTTLWETTDPTNPWRAVYHDVFHLDIFPNPDFEVISIRGGINVDEVVVDTWCAPEPATMALMGLGLLGLVVRRKK